MRYFTRIQLMSIETHAVVSWIWNADGTAGLQTLAVGDEEACLQYAQTAQPVTDDPDEVIVVVPLEKLEAAGKDRLRGLN